MCVALGGRSLPVISQWTIAHWGRWTSATLASPKFLLVCELQEWIADGQLWGVVVAAAA